MQIRTLQDLRRSNIHRLKEKFEKINGHSITVGVHRKDNKPYPDRDITPAQVGFFHEYGTTKMVARVWLRIFSLISSEKKDFFGKIKNLFTKEQNADIILNRAGEYQKEKIVGRIKTDKVTPPSKNKTGITLVDTAHFVNSIDYEVH